MRTKERLAIIKQIQEAASNLWMAVEYGYKNVTLSEIVRIQKRLAELLETLELTDV